MTWISTPQSRKVRLLFPQLFINKIIIIVIYFTETYNY